MQLWKRAGLWLAVFACVGVVGMTFRDSKSKAASHGAESEAPTPAPTVHLTASPEPGKPQPFAIDAKIARAAVRSGVLKIALPDGTIERIAIERHYTDDTGHWNVVGRAPTRLGEIPMVLTFGASAVFGTVPSPDGATMSVTTAPNGAIEINAPASGIDGVEAQVSNVATPPNVQAPPRTITHVIASAALATPTAPKALKAALSTVPTAMPAAAPIDTTPVTIEVLAAYTDEQVALRGSAAAVQTEFANLFAIANQAHIDSGSRVRLHPARTYLWGGVGTATDAVLLELLYNNYSTYDDRNAAGADLVVLLRPTTSDGTCGRAYGASAALRRTETYVDSGQVVVNVDGTCGPLTFAHETGHALGAFHDRKTSTVGGNLDQPAYHFAYGHRTTGFSTIMAGTSRGGGPRVPFFANPASTRCSPSCGVAEYADDVRAFNLLAPAIAAYRGTPGTVSIADVETIRPYYGVNRVRVPVRFTGRAGAGATFHVQVIGGTATRTVDYTLSASDVADIPYDRSDGSFYINIQPDSTVEPDETILLRLTSSTGQPVERSEATVTIVNVARPTLTGRVIFPAGTPAQTEPVWGVFEDFESPGSAMQMQMMPPDYAFTLLPPYGAELRPWTRLPAPYTLRQANIYIPEARSSRTWNWSAETGVRITAEVRAPVPNSGGWMMPTVYDMVRTRYEGDAAFKETLTGMYPGDPNLTTYIPRGAHVTFRASEFDVPALKEGFVGAYDAAADRDVVMWVDPAKYSINAWPADRDVPDTKGLSVYLNGPVPAGGGSFRCTTIDGTAKAGIDYVAMSAVKALPAGATGMQYCGTVQILRNADRADNWFEFEISEVSGAVLQTQRARVTIPPRPLRTGGGGKIERL